MTTTRTLQFTQERFETYRVSPEFLVGRKRERLFRCTTSLQKLIEFIHGNSAAFIHKKCIEGGKLNGKSLSAHGVVSTCIAICALEGGFE